MHDTRFRRIAPALLGCALGCAPGAATPAADGWTWAVPSAESVRALPPCAVAPLEGAVPHEVEGHVLPLPAEYSLVPDASGFHVWMRPDSSAVLLSVADEPSVMQFEGGHRVDEPACSLPMLDGLAYVRLHRIDDPSRPAPGYGAELTLAAGTAKHLAAAVFAWSHEERARLLGALQGLRLR